MRRLWHESSEHPIQASHELTRIGDTAGLGEFGLLEEQQRELVERLAVLERVEVAQQGMARINFERRFGLGHRLPRRLENPSHLRARVTLGELDCDVLAVVSDKPAAAALAERHNVPFVLVDGGLEGADRSAQEAAFAAALESFAPELVVLARYMRILPAEITERWAGRMINIHHSFLPAFPGARPYMRAHQRGVKLIGATAHYVTAELDAGPIIAQGVATVSHRDEVEDLGRKGRDVERKTLADAVRLHLEHRVLVWDNRTCVFGE